MGTANQTIQNTINAVRTDAAGKNPVIQFGNNGNELNIGTATASFNNSGGTWGAVTLKGKISSAVNNNDSSTINIGDSVSVTSMADIKRDTAGIAVSFNSTGTLSITGGTVSAPPNGIAISHNSSGTVSIAGGTVSAASGYAVYNNHSGAVNISGGTVSATTGYAVYNASIGKITVSGTAKLSSASTEDKGTIYLGYNGVVTATLLEITGGTVENTSAFGNAVCNDSAGAVSISGGTVSSNNKGTAVYNKSTGAITISGGLISGGSTNCYAVLNERGGTLSITGGTVWAGGDIITVCNAGMLSITGGTVSATKSVAVENLGTLIITGGTVSATSGIAVSHWGGTVSISDGMVSATTGIALSISYSGGGTTVSGTAKVTSANTETGKGTIYIATSNWDNSNGPLIITGGRVENTSTTTGNAIRNDNSTRAVSITGGTVYKAGDSDYAVNNAGGGAVTIKNPPAVSITGNHTGSNINFVP